MLAGRTLPRTMAIARWTLREVDDTIILIDAMRGSSLDR
jgi:hypothetical protein